ncbi:fatty-acid amide hydrolase 2-A [Trichonephila inaurata madagascariensis]|uniref:Fatty-acid amide hydrolase 2-A n=1 Tax=Trichonephila inaurata madagascariensis TaxID=2747483 RepID=A0A8X6YMM1_9ARAC|nr:fatty-acid amide hydrolase 2-A [Trichonephila inaurata madagascariensis]
MRATNDAECVRLFKEAGAIVIATTNVPEFGMNTETVNYLHGRTKNPYDTNRGCGGSSGGESSLIGAGGSVIGLGNDILGSVRIPTHFCGIYGHKSTHDLVPNKGSCPPDRFEKMQGAYNILEAGPMCRYAEDLITTMRVLAVGDEEIRRKIGQPVDFKKLKVLYLTEIGMYLMCPIKKDLTEAMKNVGSYFSTRYGVEYKEIKLPFLRKVTKCFISELQQLMPNASSGFLDGIGRPLNKKWDLIKSVFGKSVLSFNINMIMNFADFPLVYRKSENSYYNKMWQEVVQCFDDLLDENTVLLLPSFPTTALYHHEMIFYCLPCCPYAGLFNLLGLPATQCQIGYDSEGLPYGVQIIGRKNNDNLTISCAVELEKAFGGWRSPGKV